jgi:hypothetical protein
LHNAAEFHLAGIPAFSIKPKKHVARRKWFQNLISGSRARQSKAHSLELIAHSQIRWKAGKPGGWNAGKLKGSKDCRLYSFPASKHQAFETYQLSAMNDSLICM